MTSPLPLTVDAASGTTVEHDIEGRRYRIRDAGGYIGLIDYTFSDDGAAVAMTHTEVNPDRQGGGIAGLLVGAALDDVRARGLAVDPVCPYIRVFIRRHPEYADLVAG